MITDMHIITLSDMHINNIIKNNKYYLKLNQIKKFRFLYIFRDYYKYTKK